MHGRQILAEALLSRGSSQTEGRDSLWCRSIFEGRPKKFEFLST